MATTSVDTTRATGAAVQTYFDAAFIRDDKKLYFGDSGDMSLHYDSSNDLLCLLGVAAAGPSTSDTGVAGGLWVSDYRLYVSSE